ncbi:hypothetical protein [Pedobacter frigoris]|uniref:Glycosyltransferase RgtA/B/C/D-like domain-containing protein n=1 Tax=Pedobacter frigoris TaxID=2571272 RepID=A0A4U1CLK8_9SPHI|nr:hypothetical protein [Pedobacter frigoris]TKC07191.1 hypothetical protein FA047_08000 [Pedobacter frigoris]
MKSNTLKRFTDSKITSFDFIILTIVLSLIIYGNLRLLGFSKNDDSWMLLENPFVINAKFSAKYFISIFSEFYGGQYSPVNTLYYVVLYKIFGPNPLYFHLGSLLLHTINTYLIYIFINQILIFIQHKNLLIAPLVAILWCIHPLNVESVVWISASKIPLYSFFGLLSLIRYLKFLVSKSKLIFLFSVVAFLISCLCKEQAVLLCMMVVLLHYLFAKDTKWYFVLPFVTIMLIFTVIGFLTSQDDGQLSLVYDHLSLSHRILLSIYSICFYIFNSILPLKLSYYYPFEFSSSSNPSVQLYVFPIILFSLVFLMLSIKKQINWKIILVGSLTFGINLLLSVHLMPLHRQSMLANRYAYIPLIGILLIIIYLVFYGLDSIKHKSTPYYTIVLLLIYGGYLLYSSSSLVFQYAQYNI